MPLSNRLKPELLMLIALFGSLLSPVTQAHDPVFGLGPHVLFKDGIEIAPEVNIRKKGESEETEFAVELTYGLTGDWAAGIEVPYAKQTVSNSSNSGQDDVTLFTKYRFWRDDGPGVQESMSVAFKLKTDTGDSNIGSGTTDSLLGLTYGYEGRKWYRWAAVRYRYNDENKQKFRRGNKLLFDLVGGIRIKQTHYREPDTVWILELNGESSEKAEQDGMELSNSGGNEWFVSPGIFWTKRNFAVKAGIQIPLTSNLNGNQAETDYRAKLVLEWHL